MSFDTQAFFRACNPSKTLDISHPQDLPYYVDCSEVRGRDLVRELARTVVFSGEMPTCQLFTGHIGCGKSTELLRLKRDLEQKDYHVVYFESTDDLDMADVDISDILLVIARQVSLSLEAVAVRVQPQRFQQLLQGALRLLGREFPDSVIGPESPGVTLSARISRLTQLAKQDKEVRSLLRQYLEPRINSLLSAINTDLIEAAQHQLLQQGKAGLVVIVDNLDRIDNQVKLNDRQLAAYLFVDRGDQLKQLRCHVIYTMPLMLSYSHETATLTNRFGVEPQVLPMVRLCDRAGQICEDGLAVLRQMVLARALPDLPADERLRQLPQLFDSLATLNTLCQASGGHARSLLVLLIDCIKKSDPPFTADLLQQVLRLRHYELVKAIDDDEWALLRQVHASKQVQGQAYHPLLHSLFILEYRDAEETWFDLNPILLLKDQELPSYA